MVVALESEEHAVNLFHSGIFIFSMKKENMFIDVIQIQALEWLFFVVFVFIKTRSRTPPTMLLVVIRPAE